MESDTDSIHPSDTSNLSDLNTDNTDLSDLQKDQSSSLDHNTYLNSLPSKPTQIRSKILSYRTKFTQQQILEYKEIFTLFDVENAGGITTESLGNVMLTLGHNPTVGELQDMIDEVDVDTDGKCDFDEFLVLMAKQTEHDNTEDEIREILSVFDKSGDGKIPVSEVREYLGMFGDRMRIEEIDQLINETDLDKDGFIWYEDFVQVILGD